MNTKRKALGQGLNALLPPPRVPQKGSTAEVYLALLKPNPRQPRTRFTTEQLQELAESIKAHGLVQPIVVRPQGARFQIVAGERRWRAAQLAGLKRVPVTVLDIADDQLLEVALLENLQREELTPIDEARAYRTLIGEMKYTQEELGRRLGRKRATIANALRLLDLPEKVQALVEEGTLTPGHGKAVLSAPDGRRWEITETITQKGLNVRQAETLARRMAASTAPARKAAPTGAVQLNKIAARLATRLGTRVAIQARKRGGKIVIAYFGDPDLQRILDILLR